MSGSVGNASDFIRGITFKPNELIAVEADDAIVCMRTKNVQKDLDDRDLIAVPSRLVRNKEKLLRHGDILISSANSWELVGKCSYVGELAYPATAGGFIAIVRPKKHTHPRYLYHWLTSPKTQHKIRHCGRQTTNISNLDVGRFKELPFPEFEFDEQRRIAALLDKADAIRRKRQQVLALADDFLKSVFLEMFGDPHRNPHNYPVRKLETLLTIPLRNGISPSSKGAVSAGVLTLSAITGEKFDATQIKEGKFLRPISRTDQVDVGDFYICRGNGSPDLVGKGYFASKSMEGVAFPDTMIAAKINAEEVCRGFFEMIWNSQFVRGQIIEAARTTNGTYKINQTATGGIKIPTPPKAAQETFEDVFRKVHHLRERLSFADDLFASLSQRAFRGEL